MRALQLGPSHTLFFHSNPISNRLEQVNTRHMLCCGQGIGSHTRPIIGRACYASFPAEPVSLGLKSADLRLTAARTRFRRFSFRFLFSQQTSWDYAHLVNALVGVSDFRADIKLAT